MAGVGDLSGVGDRPDRAGDGSADVTAQLWDRRKHTNEAIGVFASHKEAEKAIVKEWQRRNGEGV
jgi:hypothetical protein